MLSLLMKWNLFLLHSSRKWSLTCLMILVSLNCLLINIEEIITSYTPYIKHFFPMSIIRFELPFAPILLIVLCVISFEPTWIITMLRQSFSRIAVMNWSNLLIVAPLNLFKCALPSIIELLNKFFLILRIWLSPTIHVFLLYFVVSAYDWLPATVLREFLLSVLFWLSVIALVGRMLCELFFYALNLDLVFVIWQRLWWLVGVWSCGSWISIWFTSVTIRLSNRFYKFIGEGFLGDTEVGDAMFVLLFDLAFTVFHPSVHLSFVISISITAYWFLISFLRHWFSFSSILIFSNKMSAGSFLIALFRPPIFYWWSF